MLLTLTTTLQPATDLGYLLHKHPEKLQSFEVAVGVAHVFYPEAGADRCTAALLLEVDPVGLVRGHRGPAADGPLGQYVNDRPYAASSMLAVAMSRVFRTAMAGRCDARPELAASALPLELHLPALACRGGPDLAARLFGPLGWAVTATAVPLDEHGDWGDSDYVDLRLTGTLRLADALQHLYVLLPVLDDAKHYWVSPDEVDKLVRAGGGWLATHPERDLITRRYLRNLRTLVATAVDRLAEVDEPPDEELPEERAVPLVRQRHAAVLAAVRECGARRVADLGCGEGALLVPLLADPSLAHVLGADVASRALERAARRVHLDEMPARQRERLTLIQSSLTYRDNRLAGFDAAVLMEVIEHLDPPRLPALGRTVFGDAAPATVIVTTPNAEYNVRFEALPGAELRHGDLRNSDHRFEWTRSEFAEWAAGICRAYGYTVRFSAVGPDDSEVGSPTQLAVFTRDSRGAGR